MLSILRRKKKKEKLGFDLQNPKNQKAIIRASLDNKIILINKGHGLFIVDMGSVKGDNLETFLKQFENTAINCKQGIVDRDDFKYDYYLIYDL